MHHQGVCGGGVAAFVAQEKPQGVSEPLVVLVVGGEFAERRCYPPPGCRG